MFDARAGGAVSRATLIARLSVLAGARLTATEPSGEVALPLASKDEMAVVD